MNGVFRNRAWKAARVTAVTEMTQGGSMISRLVTLATQVVLTWWLWRALYAGTARSAGLDAAQATTYALLGVLYMQFRIANRWPNGDSMVQLMFRGTIAYWWFRRLDDLLPFQSTLNVPLSLYIGRVPVSAAGGQLAQQAAWCAGLAVLFGQLWLMIFIVPDGLVDGYLVRPMPVYRQVLLSQFPVNAFGDSAAAVLTFALALARLHIAWTPVRIGYLVTGVFGGTLVEAALATLLAAIALRYPVGFIWHRWLDTVLGTLGNYPLKILPLAPRAVLTFVLPVAFIAYLPAAVITGRVAGSGVASWLAYCSPLAGLLLYLASRWVWAFALRHYQSIGG